MYNQFVNRVAGNRENVYVQLRPFLFKATKNQSLPVTPGQIIQIWQMETLESLILFKVL